MKGNVINLNTLHLNSVRLNGIGKVQSVSLKGGSTEDPVFPPVEPPVEPTPTYTLSASVINGKVSATLNGSAVNLPFTANEGDVIVVEVTPNDGYTFEGWNDGNTDNPRSITMTADVALSAQCVEVVQPPVGKYIQFEDAEVERVLMSKGVSSDGVGITIEDAERVTTISTWFKGNTTIQSFEEIKYFKLSVIADTAFDGCVNLGGKIELPYAITIGRAAFYNTAITSLYAPKAVTLSNQICHNCTQLVSVSLPSAPSIPYRAFSGCANLKTIEISADCETIGGEAFYGCSSLEIELSLKNAITIDVKAFALSSIVGIEAHKVTKLQQSVFDTCANLQYAKMLGATIAYYRTFYNCANLKTIELGADLATIAAGAITNCNSLEHILIRSVVPPTLDNVNGLSNTNNCPIYVPDASLEAYKTAVNWSAYADRIHPLSEIEGSLVFYDKLVGDGTAYINTEYYAKGTDGFAWSADRPTNWNKFIFGCKSSALNLGVLPINESQTYYLVGSAGATAVTEDNRPTITRELIVTQIDGSLHRVLTDNGEQTKDFGAVGSYADKTSSAPLLLFSCQTNATNATADRIYNGTIRSFSITDIDGNTIMSLKPCTFAGDAGMWDEVNGKFYGNAATSGEFSVAND